METFKLQWDYYKKKKNVQQIFMRRLNDAKSFYTHTHIHIYTYICEKVNQF